LNSAPNTGNGPRSAEIAATAVSAQLSRLTSSRTFSNAPVLRNLLTYLVTRTLEGDTDQLKEYSLGVEVFGRGTSFDPRLDTIVRVQARRLRAKLAEYYRDEGPQDPVVIELPKGHYLPAFRSVDGAGSAVRQAESADRSTLGRWLPLAAVSAVLLTAPLLLRSGFDSRPPSFPTYPTTTVAPTPEPPRQRPLRVVVAPFENHAESAALDPVGQRVAEHAIAAMAAVEGVEVAARPSALAHNDGTADIVVSGGLYPEGQSLELRTRIADARTGRLLHGFSTIAPLTLTAAASFDSLAQQIAGAIAAHQDDFFGGLDIISHPPTLDAYREYRAGLELFQSDYRQSLARLQRSHERAPHFLPPLVVMIFAHGSLGERDKAGVLLAEMHQIADRLTGGERLIVEFLRSNREGRRGQALRVLEELERIAPTSLLVNYNLMRSYVVANRPQAAVATYLRQPFVSKALRHSVESYRRIWFLDALHMLGAYDRELQESRLAQADAPGVLAYLQAEGRALIALGRRAELDDIIERSESLPLTAGWLETPGEVMEHMARELRAHASRPESVAMARMAAHWHRGRSTHARADQRARAGEARALYLAERWHEAAALFEELARDSPREPLYRAWLAQAAARDGDVRRAHLLSSELD
jgi:tetratricopeptide (TPR) repeat protein